MTGIYAQPYSLDHAGSYFEGIETCEAGMKHFISQGCEEVEIQLIDADDYLVQRIAAASTAAGYIGCCAAGSPQQFTRCLYSPGQSAFFTLVLRLRPRSRATRFSGFCFY